MSLSIKKVFAALFNVTHNSIAKRALAFSLLCLSCNSSAVESELDKETTVFNQTFSWQAMAQFSIHNGDSPLKDVEQEGAIDHLSLSILIDLYYKGFFIQSNHRRSSGLKQGAEIGYQLHVDDNWELDVLTKTYIKGYDPELLIENKEKDIPTLRGLSERKIGDGIALRYSYFNEDSVLSVDFANFTHWTDTDGWLLDFYYNDLIIYKNWDIYVGGSITYYSKQVTNYYYGVAEHEVTADRSFYQPNNAFKATAEIYAQYPLSLNWSFNVGLTQTYYSNVIGRSPLVDKQHISQFMLGVIYVF